MNSTTTKPTDQPITRPKSALDRLDPTRRRAEILICNLAQQFDCLQYKPQWFRPGHFDAEKLERDSRFWSTGEIHCVNFILAVWSGNDWKEDKEAGIPDRSFKLINAMGTLGRGNVEPIINWMSKPFWP
jgi:hypothetical protein